MELKKTNSKELRLTLGGKYTKIVNEFMKGPDDIMELIPDAGVKAISAAIRIREDIRIRGVDQYVKAITRNNKLYLVKCKQDEQNDNGKH